ncbi:PepSY domain-containing protein [Patulibacter americanus]|uniref:PepSY domain-containing protein n=1 Tax=Patulibacter americanus TaxID=588672 RepID=UPI0003B2FF2E|nr:PepSY domain-containing protein [Patulibacter americanus]
MTLRRPVLAVVLLLLALATTVGLAGLPDRAAAQGAGAGSGSGAQTGGAPGTAAPPGVAEEAQGARTLPGSGTPALKPTTAGSTDPNAVTNPATRDTPPAGHRLTADQAQRIARADPKVAKVRRETKGSYDSIFLKGQTRWQLSLYAPGKPLTEIGQVLVDDRTGKVTESWDVPYVAWTMARGYDGAFGRSVTNPWLWALLLVLFLLPFVRLRPLRGPPVPLLLLAGFTAPLAFFNNARLDWAVPLSFALLVGLFGWATWRGVHRPRKPARDVRMLLPTGGLVLLGVALLVFRIVLNVTDGNVIDVGYASVVGASKVGAGETVYGVFPSDVGRGDTYGPLTYLAYVPFEQLFPWGGRWDDLPAAHAAAIGFDVLAATLLFFVGRRQEHDGRAGTRRGILYAYLWLACPWTAYCLNSNANDALPAAALALLLLVGARPFARGMAAGAAGAAKIAPFAVLPVLMTRRRVAPTVAVDHGPPAFWPTRRRGDGPARGVLGAVLVLLGALVVVAVTALIALDGRPLRVLFDRTIGYQAGRPAPFMPWGFYDWLDWARDPVRYLAIAFALVVAVLPRRHDLTGTAALVMAVILGLQLATEYWFYLYLTWLIPLIFVAAVGDRRLAWPGIAPAPSVMPRMHGPLTREDAPWATDAPATGSTRAS